MRETEAKKRAAKAEEEARSRAADAAVKAGASERRLLELEAESASLKAATARAQEAEEESRLKVAETESELETMRSALHAASQEAASGRDRIEVLTARQRRDVGAMKVREQSVFISSITRNTSLIMIPHFNLGIAQRRRSIAGSIDSGADAAGSAC